MNLATTLEEQAGALERDAMALRKLSEAATELGEERVRALLAPMLNGNGNANGNGNGHHTPVAESTAAPESEEAVGPRGREAVRRIVRERPGLWTLTDLRAEMKDREWFTSAKAVDVAVTRMCRKGEARRTSQKGIYEFPAANSDQEVLA